MFFNYNLFRVKFRLSRVVFFTAICSFMLFGCYFVDLNNYVREMTEDVMRSHNEIVYKFYENHKGWNVSKLGEVLYKNELYPEISGERRNKTFVIWKENHHVGPNLSDCSVQNCIFTGNKSKLESADAVIVRLQLGVLPSMKNRNPKQRWLFLTDESPLHSFSMSKSKMNLTQLHNVFNWSLTYRSDADVPVPYGRTVALKAPKIPSPHPSIAHLVPNWKDKKPDVLLAILISNCDVSYRMSVIKQLQQHMDVDVHGKCGDKTLRNSCPGHFRVDCETITQYFFYLALENSKCKEYMTEKIFHNAYSKGAIPVIQGPSLEDCERFLPPLSYIHLDNYASLKDLAEDLVRISKSEKELLSFHRWRNHFEVVNEHGYFGVKPLRLCRVCEALNYNDDTESVYSEERLREFLDPTLLCRKR